MRYLDEVLADRPLAVWPLNDPDTVTRDAGPNGRVGAADAVGTTAGPLLTGPTPQIPLARAFSSGHATGIVNAAWMEVAAVTAEIWFYADTLGSTTRYLMTRGNDGGASANSFMVDVTTSSLLRGRYWNGASVRTVTGATTIVTGRWYHAVAWLGSGTARLYLNGEQDGSAGTSLAMNTGATALRIGRETTGTGNLHWDGRLAYAAYYDYELPLARVRAHYSAAFTNNPGRRIIVPGYAATTTPERTATDAPTVSESVTRLLSASRATTDATSTSDTATRVVSTSRSATDAPSTSESVTRAITEQRIATDAPATSESVVRAGIFSRATSDAPTTSDSVVAEIEGGDEVDRTATDAVATSESATRSVVSARSTTDAPAVSEAGTRALALPRSTADTTTITDSATPVVSIVRTATDAPTTSESVVRSGSFSRSTADAPTTSVSSDADTGGAADDAFQQDAFQDSPAFQTGGTAAVSLTATDAVVVTDSATAFVNVVEHSATDSVSVTDAAVAARTGYHRTVTDSVAFAVPVELCLDFDSGIPAEWTNSNFVETGGAIVLEGGSFGASLVYGEASPNLPTTVQFDFKTPSPISSSYWYIEVDAYGMYVLVDNQFDAMGDFGIYVKGTGGSVEIDPLVANTWYTVKAYFDRSLKFSQAKLWLQGDPEPPDWDVENTYVGTDSAFPWAIYADSLGSGDLTIDDACWTYLDTEADSIASQPVLTRTLTDDTELLEWPLHNVEVDTPIYGQDPNGYQPDLAAPIDDNDTTITVTQPLPPGTDLPILVWINGEYVLVTAVSLDGLTWTVVRGANGSSAANHSTGSILPANTTISIGGVQAGADVIYSRTRLSTFVNGHPGTGEIWVRDVERMRSFTTGAEVVVRHRNVRVWGGYIANVKRAYTFPGGSGDPDDEPRYLVLEVVDYNILLLKRIYHDKDTPTHMKVHTWLNGTPDDAVIGSMLNRHLDLRGDGLSYDVHRVGTPGLPVDSCNPDAPDRFQIAWAGYTWQDAMRAIADQTGGIYYIDPDKVFRYVDDSVKQSVFGFDGLSDAPGGTMIGYRDFELSHDGTKLVNEQFTWGVGQGATAPVLGHATAPGSITDHGLWQQAELRYDMYCQGTVDLRANTWLDGSPQNRRGYKSDHVAARMTVFTPYFRAADVVTLESTTFDFDDVIPVRGVEITFPTPWDIQCVLTISHEKDSPWEAYEFAFPRFPFDFDIPRFPPFDFIPTFPPGCDEEAPPTTLPAPPGLTWADSSFIFRWKVVDGVIQEEGAGPTPLPVTLGADVLNDLHRPAAHVTTIYHFISGNVDTTMAAFSPHVVVRAPENLGPGGNQTNEFQIIDIGAVNAPANNGAEGTAYPNHQLGRLIVEGFYTEGGIDNYELGSGVTGTVEGGLAFYAPGGEVWLAVITDQAFSDLNGPTLVDSGTGSILQFANPGAGFWDDPCEEEGVGDPTDDGVLYGERPNAGVELDNGNFLYVFDQQFLPFSTEVWADGLRLRVDEDYTEHPFEAAIEIHSDAQSGFTTFDPGMAIVANMMPFVTHDPPPEYIEP